MQEVIQAQAERIAQAFGVNAIIVARHRELDETGRYEAMRHEMAHHIHQVKDAAKSKGNNPHGRNWRKVAERVGAEPKAQVFCAWGKARKAAVRVAAPKAAARFNVIPAAPKAPAFVENPKNKAEWEAYIAAKGLRELGHGASRTTYALDAKRVVKIGNGWEQCLSEWNRWNEANAEQRQYLAECFDGGVGFIVMERAKCTLKEFINDRQAVETICHDMSSTTGIGDMHQGNIGYFGAGKFKIIDYAL